MKKTYKILVVDHYDSFTFNLLDWLGDDFDIHLINFDDPDLFKNVDCPIVLSPGPNDPTKAPETMRFVEQVFGKVPILGICLGLQVLGVYAGGNVKRSDFPLHGQIKSIKCVDHTADLAVMGSQLNVAVYHSLVVSEPLASSWKVVYRCLGGEIQGVEYHDESNDAPVYGVQFHPESFLSEGCLPLKQLWLTKVTAWYNNKCLSYS